MGKGGSGVVAREKGLGKGEDRRKRGRRRSSSRRKRKEKKKWVSGRRCRRKTIRRRNRM